MPDAEQQRTLSSLSEILSQKRPQFETKQALIVLSLQNDFVAADGKLPVTSRGGGSTKFLDRIKALVPAFRNAADGNVFWVRTVHEADRTVNDPHAVDGASDAVVLVGADAGVDDDHDLPVDENPASDGESKLKDQAPSDSAASPDPSAKQSKSSRGAVDALKRISARKKAASSPSSKSKAGSSSRSKARRLLIHDEELFLTTTSDREPCFLPGSPGAAFSELAGSLQHSSDAIVTTSHYSAFRSTDLLLTLRARFVTELFICGAISNINVYATAMDAARHGISVIIVDDCLGYRNFSRHTRALGTLGDVMGAILISSVQLISDMANPDEDDVEQPVPAPDRTDLPLRTATAEGGEMAKRSLKKTKVRMRTRPSKDEVGAAGSEQKSKDLSKPLSASSRRGTASGTKGSAPVIPARDSSARGHATMTPAASTVERSDTAAAVPSSTQSKAPSNSETTATPKKSSRVQSLATLPTLGPGDYIGEGDSHVQYDLLPARDASDVFERLYTQVRFMSMSHAAGAVPRLVAVQGDVHFKDDPDSADGFSVSVPVYRHPTDHAPLLMRFSPVVNTIRRAAEAACGSETKFNHALIQLYRGGTDFISEHADKTLDIVPGSVIANASFGAQRTMRLRSKHVARAPDAPKDDRTSARDTQRVPMPHNSLLILGPHTNARWLHAIQPDKRLDNERADAETSFGGWRISITLRQVATFMSIDAKWIWGQGAKCKAWKETGACTTVARNLKQGDAPGKVICGEDDAAAGEERVQLVKVFGIENREGIKPPGPVPPKSEVADSSSSAAQLGEPSCLPAWEDVYGQGYNILHFQNPPPADELVTNSTLGAVLFEGDSNSDNFAIRSFLQLQHREFSCVPATCPPLHEALASHHNGSEHAALRKQQRVPLLRGDGESRLEIEGLVPILLYLGRQSEVAAAKDQNGAASRKKVNVDANKRFSLEYMELLRAVELGRALSLARIERDARGDKSASASASDLSTLLRDLDSRIVLQQQQQHLSDPPSSSSTNNNAPAAGTQTVKWLTGPDSGPGIADCATYAVIKDVLQLWPFAPAAVKRAAEGRQEEEKGKTKVQEGEEEGKEEQEGKQRVEETSPLSGCDALVAWAGRMQSALEPLEVSSSTKKS